jgi:hypothetical protein
MASAQTGSNKLDKRQSFGFGFDDPIGSAILAIAEIVVVEWLAIHTDRLGRRLRLPKLFTDYAPQGLRK